MDVRSERSPADSVQDEIVDQNSRLAMERTQQSASTEARLHLNRKNVPRKPSAPPT